MDLVKSPLISVLCPAIVTPTGSKSGVPPAKIAMSVVVPPISSATASLLSFVRLRMPMTLAAGPESIDPTGYSADWLMPEVPPSAFRM